jgi:TonB family protein
MAFRVLIFSKNPETNTALTAACNEAGMRVEACSDIFAAIEKGTKQPFSCVLADWSDQPETGFLLKRARESTPNTDIVVIAIVDHDPTTAEMRDHRLDFLIYRPIFPGEAQQVLAKAAEKMPSVSGQDIPAAPAPKNQSAEPPSADTSNSHYSDEGRHESSDTPQPAEEDPASEESAEEPTVFEHSEAQRSFSWREGCAAGLILAALFFLWNARETFVYLAQTREGRVRILKESAAALFYMTPSGATPMGTAGSEARQDAYFSRGPATTETDPSKIGVVSTQAEVNDAHVEVRKPVDFPLPAPVYEPPPPPPVHVEHAAIPDSLRGSTPITRPVVVTVSPAQMMPVSMPATGPVPQPVSEPVSISESAARAMLVQGESPAYPAEAAAQKLQGPVVLQAMIGRDGSVEDLKIVRGSFLLCKAAIPVVKQWRFQPYNLNGHSAQTTTTLTIDFSAAPQ